MSVFRTLLTAALLAGHAFPAVAQEWVAQVKSAPQDYRERVIRLKGDVVELRGATSISAQGLYRLVDASDPTGIMLRTTLLPETSGPFEVRARLSPELLLGGGGALLLDEIDRTEPFQALSYVPGLVAIAGLVLTVLMGWRFAHARKHARHQHLAPPMWLIPTVTEGEETGGGGKEGQAAVPAVRFNYRLQYVAEERSAALDRAKRRTYGGMAGASVMMLAGIGWWMVSRAEANDRPTFVLISPVEQPGEVLGEVPVVAVSDDSATVPLAVATRPIPPPPTPPQVTRPQAEPVASTPRRDTAQAAPATPPPAPRPTTPSVRTQRVQPQPLPPPAPIPVPRAADSATTARDSVRTALPIVRRPVVTSNPVTPPPAPPPPPPPPPPDPAVERAAATRALTSGGSLLVAAINAKQTDRVGSLYTGSGNREWLTRFLNHLRSTEPTAVLGTQGSVTVTGDDAEAEFVVSLRWRANFGVERKGDARFAAVAQRSGDTWRLVGVRLLQRFP